MLLEPIDNRLYKVSNVLPDELVTKILEIAWEEFSYETDERMPHRKTIFAHGEPGILTQAETIFHNLYKQIEETCKIQFSRDIYFNTIWWYNQPGFKVGTHTDGHLPSSLQLFWSAPGEQYGTKFYNSKCETDIKYDFPFIPNTGYLMLNCPNPDGSQPLQWHGMPHYVPEGSHRLTSYTQFGTYTDK